MRQLGKHKFSIRYLGYYNELAQLVQLLAVYIQVKQGYWQNSHWLVEFFPYWPSGQTDVHIVCEIIR